ncbi:Ldh family oxidoreductase [Rhizobium sp. AU243]|uniref:Ldh family oxidoreductase n=1 Tax=Rhizobium sp. AU243 TaxID=2303425 RepID=UPI0010CB376E|nr:Ldh family oxidoreductase [Rhizobium sp. AU243]TKV70558.1 Ldh family oxidoreductase [Rhizobium sp. AU243]
MSTNIAYVDPDALIDYAAAIFEKSGLRAEDAKVVGEDLVIANLRGLDSHGVSRIPMYLERLRKGVVKAQPDITFEKKAGAVGLVDGGDGMGFLAAHRAMDEAITLADESGIGMVGVRRSTHYGMGALYVLQAMRRGYISFAWTNSSPAIPVHGGRTTFLGAAPFAAGIPGGSEAPYVLDMAMTVIARGKIRLAAQHGLPIAEGLALDGDGAPTTDAKKAFEGVCLPFGGVKGSALSMLMDLMCGALTGANYGGQVKSLYFDHSEPQNVGHMMIAIRPNLFMPGDDFAARMDDFVQRAKACPKAQNFDEILMPGEPEERTTSKRSISGVPITAHVLAELKHESDQLGIRAIKASDMPFAAA